MGKEELLLLLLGIFIGIPTMKTSMDISQKKKSKN